MAAAAWFFHGEGIEDLLDGTSVIGTATFKCILTDAAYTPAQADTSFTNQLSTANGYTADGITCTITVTNSSGTITIDSTTDPSWTASGAGIAAANAHIIKSSSTQPIFTSVLNAGTNLTATAGNPFTITMNASGICSLAAA